MAPGVCLTVPETPSLPLPPIPVGQLTADPLPTLVFQSVLTFARYVVKILVVPLPSERCAIRIAVEGNFTPLLAAAILGSFHLVIVPRNMPAMISGVRLRVSFTSGRL